MTDEIVARVARSRRYRDVDPNLVRRLADEEARGGGAPDLVAKRVKRRLHQAVGAFRGATSVERVLDPLRAAWDGDMRAAAFLDACVALLATHASTRERLGDLERVYDGIWDAVGGAPATLWDLGCGLGPVTLPWMRLSSDARYLACDADAGALAVADAFLDLVGQPHAVEPRDLVAGAPTRPADVALLLKTVTTLDRQDPAAAACVLRELPVRHAAVSFPRASLGGRGRGMERTYRTRLDALVDEVGRVRDVAERSTRSELIFVLRLADG